VIHEESRRGIGLQFWDRNVRLIRAPVQGRLIMLGLCALSVPPDAA
jgi:hypothetical protein